MMSRVLRPTRRLPHLLLGLGLAIAASKVSESPEEEKGKRRGRAAYKAAIERSRDLLQRLKDEVGSPGLVVGVSVDGETVWAEGLGFSDVENRIACSAETVMRVASISKSFTMTAVAKLWEEGRLDLDVPVQTYVPEFPEKEYEGEKVTITARLLASHLSGIRHYNKTLPIKEPTDTPAEEEAEPECRKSKRAAPQPEEFYIKDKYDGVIESLQLFKDDPLVCKPGSHFLYSTHAWTLLSAVVERASGRNFLDHMMQMFHDLGMKNTVPEEHEPIIYNRARFYSFNKQRRLVNSPYVDNSYKWGGGGFLSTVGDLLKFGNVLLYSSQARAPGGQLPGYLKSDTVSMLWRQVANTVMSWDRDGKYGMGWGTVQSKQDYGECKVQRHYVSHTGAAIGASSILLIMPEDPHTASPPRGIVVTVIVNMQQANLNSTALTIAMEFHKAKMEEAGKV